MINSTTRHEQCKRQLHRWRIVRVLGFLLLQPQAHFCFQNQPLSCRHPADGSSRIVAAETPAVSQHEDIPSCFYNTQQISPRGRPIWKPRIQLQDLQIGDRLEGYIVQEHLEGVTGPKVFLECGVGRYSKGKWNMVNAMARLGHRGSKVSVTQKRAARLRKKMNIECFVSRIHVECGRLEVVFSEADVPARSHQKITVTSLQPGQEMVGKIQRLTPYGAFVDVGANRDGLLHIQKVANLYHAYIDKEKGLKEAGLERGSQVKLQVESNEKRRLFLDFTLQTKQDAENERFELQKLQEEQKHAEDKDTKSPKAAPGETLTSSAASGTTMTAAGSISTSVSSQLQSEEEEDAWAAYAANDDFDDEDDTDDDYDEDRDIEDALGLGTY